MPGKRAGHPIIRASPLLQARLFNGIDQNRSCRDYSSERAVAITSAGQVVPIWILRKFAAYSRQTNMAAALHNAGRIDRKLFRSE